MRTQASGGDIRREGRTKDAGIVSKGDKFFYCICVPQRVLLHNCFAVVAWRRCAFRDGWPHLRRRAQGAGPRRGGSAGHHRHYG